MSHRAGIFTQVSTSESPIQLAVVNDYEIVVRGIFAMLEPFADRVRVVELDSGHDVANPVDIALYDSYSMPATSMDEIATLSRNPNVGQVVLYTWVLTPQILSDARRRGMTAALPKGIDAEELVEALERIHSGEQQGLTSGPDGEEPRGGVPGSWPGRDEGLTARESEIVALVTDGLSNNEIASRTYLSINSVKSYIRSAYRTMGVSSRSQAVLWGIDHGFARTRVRIVEPDQSSTAGRL